MELLKKKKFQVLYAPQQDRRYTDLLCTVIGAIFAITMLVVACIMWNPTNFHRNFSSYYGANNQILCQSGQHLLYPKPDNLNNHQCVTICPSVYTDLNGLCLPIDDIARQEYLDNPQISVLVYGNQFFRVLLYTAIISLSLGLFSLFLANIIPRLSVQIVFYASILLLICVGILLLVLYDQFWRNVVLLKILVAVVCFILALIIVGMICMYSNQIKIYGIFVQFAILYLNQHKLTYAYIPLFLLFTVGLVALISWQHCSFTSSIGTSRNIFNLNDDGIWGVLNILQFIWGIQFLRDSFNFCVSGNVVNWYWKKNNNNCIHPFKRYLCKNWGSVVFGSFLNAFFQILTLLFQLFRCHPNTLCDSAGNFCQRKCKFISSLFDLVRTDAYAFINITGLPYCDSSKQCRRLCSSTDIFVGIQSPMKHYRFTAHIAFITSIYLISWFIQRARMQYYGIWNSAIIIVTALIIITWFINIFTDIGEAIQTCFLYEHQHEPDYNNMGGLHHSFKQDLFHHEKRMKKDGTC